MKIGTFAGHREVYGAGIDARILSALNDYLKRDTAFTFYIGDMGEFDRKCLSAVRTAKKQHPELDIKLILVLPYFSNRLNTDKDYYESSFDDVIVPEELAGVHYKSAITKRNRWMINKADFLIAYVHRDFGGAFATMSYANKLKKDVINLAEK